MNPGLLVSPAEERSPAKEPRLDGSRWRELFVALALLASASCLGPTLSLDASEQDASIYVDGEYVGTGSTTAPQAYYGVAHVTIAPARTGVVEDVRTSERRSIELPPPAPRWLFPLDFFLEAFARGFGDAAAVQVDLQVAAPTASLAAGVPPPAPEPLRARAAAIQLAR